MNSTQINRRAFLQVATVITAALSVPTSIKAVAGVLTDQNRLSDSERQVFEKMLAVCLPTEQSTLIDPASLPVIATLEAALLAGMSTHIRQGIRGGVEFFNQGPKAQWGKPFVELPAAQATTFIEQWADSDQVPERALASGLKKLTMMAYWAIPDTWVPIGYDGPVSTKWKIPSLGNAPEPKA